jgi:uncharacterized protein YcgL (UPF0745 family)
MKDLTFVKYRSPKDLKQLIVINLRDYFGVVPKMLFQEEYTPKQQIKFYQIDTVTIERYPGK